MNGIDFVLIAVGMAFLLLSEYKWFERNVSK